MIKNIKRFFRFSLVIIFVMLNVFFYHISVLEMKAYEYLTQGRSEKITDILSSKIIVNRTYEDVMIRLLDNRQLDLAKSFADNLILNDPLCAPAYYVRSAYYVTNKNLAMAKIEIQSAIKIDTYNDTFLIAASLIELKNGSVSKSRELIEKARLINPDRPALKTMESLIRTEVQNSNAVQPK